MKCLLSSLINCKLSVLKITLPEKRLHRRLWSYTEYRNVENLLLKQPVLFVFDE